MRNARGQVTVLVLGLTMVTIAVSGLAVDGTRAFLLRRTLQNLADSATLAGANEVDVATYYSSGGQTIRLDPDEARQITERWVADRHSVVTGVEIEATGQAVSVFLRGEVSTLFLRVVGIDRVEVSAMSHAEPVAGDIP